MRRYFQIAAILVCASIQGRAQIAVVSAASYQPVVAPNSLAALFGSGLADSTASAELDSSGQLPTTLAGVTVSIDGTLAGLLFVSPSQINFLVPATTDIGTASVLVQSSSQFTGAVQVRNVAPAIFSLDASGKGSGAILNAVTFSGGPFLVETPENPSSDKRTRLAVFATGLRYAGNPSHDPAQPNAAIQVQAQDHLGNVYDVEYAGAAPGFFGLDQVNLIVPAAADGAGVLTLAIAAENHPSNTVTFQMASLPAASVHLASITLAQPSVIGGKDITGTISLNATARSGGFVVRLGTNSLLAQAPTSVTIPAGAASAKFTAHTSVSGTTNTVTITASANGVAQSAQVTVFPANAFKLTGVSLSASSVKGGAGVTGTVSLSGNPPLGGATILLASDSKSVQVPASVNLTFGQSSANFSISTAAVSDPQTVKITATYGDSTTSATLSVKPPLTLALASATVTGGAAVNGTISLFDPAPSIGAEISLQSTDSALATAPSSVKIAAGQRSAPFNVATSTVPSPTTVAISASYGSITQAALLTINPSGFPAPSNLAISPNIVHGGTSTKSTVTISSPAQSSGVLVDLLSDNPFAAQVAAFITIPSGQTSATFTINTVGVSSTQTATISATIGGVSKSATLTVQ
ncbi:MAG TPA: hypothetical protein VEU96_17150 [Bryobacteraceae bacterium]|nr:hypothetical protein [Bryobacteraceae bacterium]